MYPKTAQVVASQQHETKPNAVLVPGAYAFELRAFLEL